MASNPLRRWLALVLAMQVALGVIYSLATPIFEASDEIWHYPVVREIVRNRRLPVQNPGQQQPWAQEGSQPPLYYLTGALLTGWIDTADYSQTALLNPFPQIGVPGATDNVNLVAHPPRQGPADGGTALAVYLIRWLSILMGTATAWLTFQLARTALPQRPQTALLAAALVAFNPMVLFINASVNNDNLLMLLTSLALLLLARDVQSAQPGMRWRSTLLLGAVLGAAALTKVSGLVLLPAAALALTLESVRSRDWRVWLGRGLALAGMVLAISGWWYVRNLTLYGELAGVQTMVAIAGPRPAGFGLADLRGEGKSFWYSYWGLFGAFNILAPRWFYALTSALSLAAAGGLALTGVRLVRRRRLPERWQVHAVLLTYLTVTALGLARWTLLTPASQGRLMFGAVAALATYLACGLLAWFPLAWHTWLSRGLALGLATAAAILPFAAIAPAYRPAAPLAALPPDAVALEIACGDGIVLAGYRLAGDAATAGQPLDVTLYWRTERPQTEDLQLSLNAYGYQGQPVAKLDTWPGGGLRPTSLWAAGVLYADRLSLATDLASATPTTLQLALSWDRDLLRQSPATTVTCTVEGRAVDAVYLDGGALVAGEPVAAGGAAISSLQHDIQLVASEVQPGDGQLAVRLGWTSDGGVPGDYTVFVHLFDAAGNKVAQDDAPPRAGYWPTSRWRPGEKVESLHVLELPSDLPPGQYTVGVGMYDPQTGQRLAAYDAEGAEWRDWIVVLEPPLSTP